MEKIATYLVKSGILEMIGNEPRLPVLRKDSEHWESPSFR